MDGLGNILVKLTFISGFCVSASISYTVSYTQSLFLICRFILNARNKSFYGSAYSINI